MTRGRGRWVWRVGQHASEWIEPHRGIQAVSQLPGLFKHLVRHILWSRAVRKESVSTEREGGDRVKCGDQGQAHVRVWQAPQTVCVPGSARRRQSRRLAHHSCRARLLTGRLRCGPTGAPAADPPPGCTLQSAEAGNCAEHEWQCMGQRFRAGNGIEATQTRLHVRGHAQACTYGCVTLMPSRSTVLTPSLRMPSSRLAMPSSSRLTSSTYRMPLCASASSPG
jgi:hypothetical protein